MTPAQMKSVRSRLGMSQAQFAKALGVERNTVARWENGRRKISKLASAAIEHLTCKRRNGK